MKKQKTWFAEKLNGEIIELTEIEALTHFEQNQIAQRMRLKFLGTSDGSIYYAARQKVQELLIAKRDVDMPEYQTLDAMQRKIADQQLRTSYAKEVKELVDEGYAGELAKAKENGVQKPDSSLRIFTTTNGSNETSADMRNKILGDMGRLN